MAQSCIYTVVEEGKPTLSLSLDGFEERPPSKPLQVGDLCPKCQAERLDYDGTLTLACPKCGAIEGGCFT